MTVSPMTSKIHHGKNVKRLREIFGIKQEAMANDLGMSQQNFSKLEQRETIEPSLLGEVAKLLKVTPEAIMNFNEEAALHQIINNYHDHSTNTGPSVVNQYQFSPVDKIVEMYEALLRSEKQKVELLEKLLEKKNVES